MESKKILLLLVFLNGCGDAGDTDSQKRGADGRGSSGNEEVLEFFYEKGLSFETGNGVEQDLTEAIYHYSQSAAKGNAAAQFKLGLFAFNGVGGKRDELLAVSWYQKAANQGHAQAQFHMGVCYENGVGVVRDVDESVKWYKKSAAQGFAKAQYNLGVSYVNGDGVEKNIIGEARLGDSKIQFICFV